MLLPLRVPLNQGPHGVHRSEGHTGADSLSHQDPTLQALYPRHDTLSQLYDFSKDVSKKAEESTWEKLGENSRAELAAWVSIPILKLYDLAISLSTK